MIFHVIEGHVTVSSFYGWYHFGVFLVQVNFSPLSSTRVFVFLLGIYSVLEPVYHEWTWNFKPESMYAIMGCFVLPIRYSFEHSLQRSKVYVHQRAFFKSLQLFLYVIYLFGFSLMFFFFCSHTLLQNWFWCILHHVGKIFFCWFVLLDPVSVFIKAPFFR